MLVQYPKKFFNWFRQQPKQKKLFVIFSIFSLLYVPIRANMITSLFISEGLSENPFFIEFLVQLFNAFFLETLLYFFRILCAVIGFGIILGAYDAFKVSRKDNS